MHHYFEVILPNHKLDEIKFPFQLFVYHNGTLEVKMGNVKMKED